MFTGIIEEIGRVKERSQRSITIQAAGIVSDLKIGDSVAVNGVCLTVTNILSDSFHVDVMPETLRLSNLEQVQVGHRLNLERALRLGDRLSGHLVSGHIDGLGKIVEKAREANSLILDVSTSQELTRYMVKKGSIAIDGISLTIAEVFKAGFRVCLIPHTLGLTTLQSKEVGDSVNLEVDIISKYLERLVNKREGVDLGFLSEHGFA